MRRFVHGTLGLHYLYFNKIVPWRHRRFGMHGTGVNFYLLGLCAQVKHDRQGWSVWAGRVCGHGCGCGLYRTRP